MHVKWHVFPHGQLYCPGHSVRAHRGWQTTNTATFLRLHRPWARTYCREPYLHSTSDGHPE
eukprot:scaffold433264_cov42-Prasinocladus_malaysianus.AAC.2